MKPMLVTMLLAACAAGPASSTALAAPVRPISAHAAAPSRHAAPPSVECHNPAMPALRFTLESPPPPTWAVITTPHTIRFWSDAQLVGENVVSVVVSPHSTRVDAGTEIVASGGGIEVRLVDITSRGSVGQPIGFTGELVAMGARAPLACSWTP
ncbi:MAG: hypothetical protein K8W52_36290 [Deltaproteobacteria bacterium]|nr:hypothetical protein [Deltaproteobacteria bacterium]